jgi:hypothetical protein
MNTAALIKHYKNPSVSICIIEAKEIIQNLEGKNKSIEYGLDKKIQDEIYYYESAIFRAQQLYKDDAESLYGYSVRPRTPSISDSDDEVEKPSKKMDELEKKINGVDNVVYQLIGGLFNQTTQSNMIDYHLYMLNGTKYTNKLDENKIWPTTRQGDANEEEIRVLKEQVSKLEGTVNGLVQLLSEKNKISKVSDYYSAYKEVVNKNFDAARDHLNDKDPIKTKINKVIDLMTKVEDSLQTLMDYDIQPTKVSDYYSAHIEVSNNNFYEAGERLHDKDPIKIKINEIIRLMTKIETDLQDKLNDEA